MNRTRACQVLFIAAVTFLFTSCSAGGNTAESVSEAKTAAQAGTASASVGSDNAVELYPAALELPVGRIIKLSAENTEPQKALWTSSNPSVATIDNDGTITVLAAGETQITVIAGESSDTCRVKAKADTPTLAYPPDSGQDGEQSPSDRSEDNFPVRIPDDQISVDRTLFEDAEYAWQFIVNDGFDTKLRVPMLDISFLVNYNIDLDARKVGGNTLLGDYEGTMEMKMAIDKASYLSAMKSAGIPATDVNSSFSVKTVNVSFSLVHYNPDESYSAKNAYLPSDKNPISPLTQLVAMAISSADTSTSGNIDLEAEDGYGNALIADKNGNIPFVIEVNPDGRATLYLPKMLSTCDRDRFEGVLARIRLIT